METTHSPTSVTISVAPSARPPVAEQRARVCVVGVAGLHVAALQDRLPPALVRSHGRNGTARTALDVTAEHAILSSSAQAQCLPGLHDDGSRIRDAVLLALAAGASAVEVVLARIPGGSPGALDRPEAEALLDPLLDGAAAGLLVFPDLGQPHRMGGSQLSSDALCAYVCARRQTWRERRQIALLDTPLKDEELPLVVGALRDSDVALCRFRGSEEAMRVHGWRSAAAVFAGALASEPVGVGLEGKRIKLGPGRRVVTSRTSELLLTRPSLDSFHSTLPVAELTLTSGSDVGRVHAERCLRSPVGDWRLSVLSVVNHVHDVLVRAAMAFVFRGATASEAALLSSALRRGLRPLTAQGLVVGPEGAGAPIIVGSPDPSPHHPSLRATVDLLIRPWQQRVMVRLNLPPAGLPVVEVL